MLADHARALRQGRDSLLPWLVPPRIHSARGWVSPTHTRRGRPSGWRACWPAARRRCRTPPPWPQTRPRLTRRWSVPACPCATRTARRAPTAKCVAHFLLTCALHALPSAPLRGVSCDSPCQTDMCRSMCRCMRRSTPERLGGQCAWVRVGMRCRLAACPSKLGTRELLTTRHAVRRARACP